ncbi:hypothetical protein [Actinoplanes sp. M2I2]|uniref:hypothetical protein n=1 Tax=Actinoplanes sp. M2I2 TaxID=1734444 RepID=UPI002022910F|nr:hypothetical protein [Actinoplanes sp. M2I2]
MLDNLVARARTALSPEWDHGFDEAFTELVSSDPDLVQAEFDDLIAASWPDPAGSAPPPGPPAPRTSCPDPPPDPAAADPAAAPPDEATGTDHRGPPP